MKLFGEETEIADKEAMIHIVDILGKAPRGKVEFIPNEQLMFFSGKDTLTILRNGAFLQDKKGTYVLPDEVNDQLNELLNK